MRRIEIVRTIGDGYLTSNIENDEFSYPKAYRLAGLNFVGIQNENGRTFENLDLRFVHDNISLLVETKENYNDNFGAAKKQLSAYVEYEKKLTGNKIIAILANTLNDDIKVWRGIITDNDFMVEEKALRTMREYIDFYTSKINDKEKVMQNTYKLNEKLHLHGISESLRSQFVGTCLLALKNSLDYKTPTLTASQIRIGIKEILENLLNNDIHRAEKLSLLNRNILESQDIRELNIDSFRDILKFIDEKILPFINDKNTSGQDLLNLFFVTFNKYVGKKDKNQAFTPDHITEFMSTICGVNKHSIVLDPCCGSGSFLVRAMTQALDDCSTEAEQENIKKHQIFGIEFDENVFGLATTNMLIHSDGNSNIYRGSCFDLEDWIVEAKPNIILMNPPYNATRQQMPEAYTRTWGSNKKEDPSKGFYFVKYITDILNKNNINATLAVLLPVSCAIGTSTEIKSFKTSILEYNTLDAVFTLPIEIFYPGSTSTACCMVFKIGKRHNDASNPDTFFGYFRDDGFKKKKNLGRVEQINQETGNSKWVETEERWIDAYRNRSHIIGLSTTKKVSGEDEWLCEAYMETDYSLLTRQNFIDFLNNYFAYKFKKGSLTKNLIYNESENIDFQINEWREFKVGKLFRIEPTKGIVTDDLIDGIDIPYIAAKHSINGFDMMCQREDFEEWVSDGNCIVFIQIGEGGCGYANYIEDDFIGMNGKTACGYIDGIMNPAIGIFLATILCLERPKHSFGRSWTGDRLKDTIILLPVQHNTDGSILIDSNNKYSDKGYIPDWEYMERYIENLPYGNVCE